LNVWKMAFQLSDTDGCCSQVMMTMPAADKTRSSSRDQACSQNTAQLRATMRQGAMHSTTSAQALRHTTHRWPCLGTTRCPHRQHTLRCPHPLTDFVLWVLQQVLDFIRDCILATSRLLTHHHHKPLDRVVDAATPACKVHQQNTQCSVQHMCVHAPPSQATVQTVQECWCQAGVTSAGCCP
jgi:hypothetical protein